MVICDGITEIGGNVFRENNINSITIPESVTLIESNAFRGCAVSTVNYGGTEEQWNAIANGKTGLPENVNIVFNYGK